MRAVIRPMAAALFALAVVAPEALAQDKAAAIRAFEEARALVKAGRHAEACPKFELSYRLDQATGALLNLAACNEHIGKLASAWAAFREAAERARNQRRSDREREATERAKALEPRLIHLTIVSTDPDVVVTRDGIDITHLAGVELPIDPGTHAIEATAPDRIGWRHELELRAEGSRETVTIPELEAAKPVTTERPLPAVALPGRRRQLLAGLIAGTGVLALGGAAALGVVAQTRWTDAERLGCVDGRCTTEAGFNEARSARRLAVTADITAVVGGIAVVTGLVLWFTAPDARRIEVRPQLGARHIGLGVSARL